MSPAFIVFLPLIGAFFAMRLLQSLWDGMADPTPEDTAASSQDEVRERMADSVDHVTTRAMHRAADAEDALPSSMVTGQAARRVAQLEDDRLPEVAFPEGFDLGSFADAAEQLA